jgi:NADPH:quinone reductase-like Zn-dependent oxidoreductase
MKAIVYRKYGGPEVLQLQEVAKPAPKDNEILIKIKATAANSGDARIRKADPFAVRFFFGLFRPKKNILGGVLSGEVEAVGQNVTRFKVGDSIFGSTGMGFGAYAEYRCLPENAVLDLKPENLSHEEAAVIPFGGNTALHFLTKVAIRPGQEVLINGASGAVGSAAVQIAKHFGAIVTAVCSTANVKLVRSLGADKVIDYTVTDFTRNGEQYDVIFDTIGRISFAPALKSLREKGTLILGSSGAAGMLQSIKPSRSGKKVIAGVIRETNEGLHLLKVLAESGSFKPVIDRTYTLSQMPGAHAYVDGGHKKGNVAISISEGATTHKS